LEETKAMTKLIKNGNVWIDGELRQVNLIIGDEGQIAGIEESDTGADRDYESVIDAGDCLVLPGGIDAHAHIQDGVETFHEGSCAAAAGGITTVVDMPPFHVCSTPVGLRERVEIAEKNCVTDFGMHGGIVVAPSDLSQMDDVAKAGAAGFKVFMPANPPVSREVLWGAVQTAARTGLRLVIHAEESACLRNDVDWADPLGFAEARPPVAETAAAAFVLEMALAAGAPIHICHVSAGRTAELIDCYRSWGTDVTAETTPHFLNFEINDFEKLGARLKTTPPLREAGNPEILWQALADGVIDIVVSDHYLGELPQPDHQVSFEEKGAGIAGLELSLPLLFYTGVVQQKLSLKRFIEVTSERPAEIFGYAKQKGKIAPGMDADLVIFDPDKEWVVTAMNSFSRAAGLPYEGWKLTGKVRLTMVRGNAVWDGESIQAKKGMGCFVARQS